MSTPRPAPATLLIALATLLWTGWVPAQRTRYWRIDTQAEFAAGRAEGVALTSDGRLEGAPELTAVADPEQPYILSAVQATDGSIYFGTGHQGKVFRLEAGGRLEPVLTAEEPDIFALAPAPGGGVFAAASPGGRIYRLRPGQPAETVAELGVRYVWSLAVGPDNALYAGTGTEGKIFRIADGAADPHHTTAQTHVMCLTFDLDGKLLAGTAPDGLVLRLERPGQVRSLLHTGHDEIHQLAVDRYGAIHLLGIGRGQPATPAPDPTPAGESATTPSALFKAQPARATPVTAGGTARPGDPAAPLPQSAIYRLDREGALRTLWASSDVTGYAFLVEADGSVLIGTGDRGRVLAVRPDRVATLRVETGQQQVTALLRDGADTVALTSNLGRVFRFGSAPARRPVWRSAILDAGLPAVFGRLRAVFGGAVEFRARVGNTPNPDDTWNEWSAPLTADTDWAIGGPPARYLQLQVTLPPAAGPGSSPPWVESLEVSFRQSNQPPRVTGISVTPPGVVHLEPPTLPNQTGEPEFGPVSTMTLPPAIAAALPGSTMKPQSPVAFRPGQRTLTWTASDPNDDPLRFDVEVRRVGGAAWTRLAAGLRQERLTIGRDLLEDGVYHFRVTASDTLTAQPGQAMQDTLQSAAVVLDGTPPDWRVLGAARTASGVRFQLEVSDDLSPIHHAEYSSDGGATWQALSPEDGILDGLRERFTLTLPPTVPAGHYLLLRAMDLSGNMAGRTVDVP